MRITLFGVAAIAIIGAIIVFIVPLLISTDDLRDSVRASFRMIEKADHSKKSNDRRQGKC